MVNGKRTPENVYSPPVGICDRLFKFLMNTLVGKRVKHITLGGGADESNGSELLIEFRHVEAKNKKNDGRSKVADGKTEQFQPRMNSHPKKSDSRFRGRDIAVWNRGREEDDKDKDLVVIHHHGRRSAGNPAAGKPPAPVQMSDVDEIAEHFIESRLEAIRKKALTIGPDHNKPS